MENIPHALDVHAQRVLKYNFILIYDFTIIETGRFNVFFVVKGQMMLKKIAKIKNFNNFMLQHLVDFKYVYDDPIFENLIILLVFPDKFW